VRSTTAPSVLGSAISSSPSPTHARYSQRRPDPPTRWTLPRAVGAHVGLTPRRHQSGEIDYDGAVSKSGDTMLRTMLYEAGQSLLTHSGQWSWLKAWGLRVAQRRGMPRAIVAVARRLAVILHRMWVDGTEFRWSNSTTAVVPQAA
jgi:transposase